jgi:ATP-dependent HslUV protease subunit HslV
MKPNARKVLKIGGDDEIITGFAGATADAMTLRDRLEQKLEQYPGQLMRACVELAKAWRTDKYLRRLDAIMLVADKDVSLTVTGNGDVFEPHDGIISIGSGGPYALAAARAMLDQESKTSKEIATQAMKIAAEICVFTNDNFVIEEISSEGGGDAAEESKKKGKKKKK